MPAKKMTPAPIDRPLSRAYLRTFTGWSTAYPPGLSEPTSLRLMDNVYVDRNGALVVRPGLRYLTYTKAPNTSPDIDDAPGIAIDRPLIGTQETFYVTQGDVAQKALLFAVREVNGTVGFRALLFSGPNAVVHLLTDDVIGFSIPQGTDVLNFSAATTHVEYLQIDNKVLAMSDAGEDVRLFYVGAEKSAKRMGTISMPQWEDVQKLRVVHPDAAWINQQGLTSRRNEIFNPGFEIGGEYWTKSALASWKSVTSSPQSGTSRLELTSAPTRTNLMLNPLHRVSTAGITGWYSDKSYGTPKIAASGSSLKITDAKGPGSFRAYSSQVTGIAANTAYRLALDIGFGTHVDPLVQIGFYGASGGLIGALLSYTLPRTAGRWTSPAFVTPTGTTNIRVNVGGKNTSSGSTYITVNDVILCKDGESTVIFDGGEGTNYFWTGTAEKSASVYHPPQTVTLTCNRVPVKAGLPFYASIYVSAAVAKAFTLRTRSYDKDVKEVFGVDSAGTTVVGGAWVRVSCGTDAASSTSVTADLRLTFTSVPRGQLLYVDSAMLESGISAAGSYFDGSTAATPTTTNQWGVLDKPHRTYSVQTIKAVAAGAIPAETPTAKTLVATGGATANPYKNGLFYTFENEIGESAASKITEIRTLRPPSNWIWETPNAAGEPSGVITDVDSLCADQLVCSVPQAVYDQAVLDGAIRWNLYACSWSDQEPVPLVAQLVASRAIYNDRASGAEKNPPAAYQDAGWLTITPRRGLGLNEAVLPTRANRENFSTPPQSRTGLVAGDRMIVLGDPLAGLATIRWSSNRPGDYTNFSASRGGGSKTLTSGNLNIPAAIVLWQNPQSVDTLTVLCLGVDGLSISYYMMPSVVNAQSSTVEVMGFEETTNTSGTVSPYGNEVLNNALYRPTDRSLLKSTASNYNISHKSQSDKVENMWRALLSKEWIMSAQLNNRLFYLVNNPYGNNLEEGCRGNEIWQYDIASDAGSWSRLTVQGLSLRVVSVSGKDYLAVGRPEGLFYLDLDSRQDDYVDLDPTSITYLKVLQRPIAWSFETNVQGANRAHDAWAHLQFIQITMGNFIGSMRYGIRGKDVHGQMLHIEKTMSDNGPMSEDGTTWDIDDGLQVRRDLKEWYFFASSIDGLDGAGEVCYVQYRYAPVTVNVGYEYGSVETFEYGSNLNDGPSDSMINGIPVPTLDYSRP